MSSFKLFRIVADCSHIPQLQLEHVRDIVQIPQAFLTRLGVNICDGRFTQNWNSAGSYENLQT